GDLFSRSWRSLTGKELQDDLRPSVQYSDAAVVRLIDKVRRSVERPATDATAKISGAGVTAVPGADGLAIQASALHREIGAAITPAWHVPNSTWAGDLAGKTIAGDDPGNPIKARWLGIYDGVGIHGTSDDASIGHNASHGCIRMHIPDVEKLYDEVPVGSAV